MSDMSGPRPHPSRAAHEQHDQLLVAQLVAGDPLDEARARQARAWLSGCPACVQLASDLRHVSALVASEPVPPRRRDFRLDPATAERLDGNALTRFLRGLAWPRSRALRPAAAGILSLGLVFMVAGYAWPEDGSITMQGGSDTLPPPSELGARTTPGVEPEPPADDLSVRLAPEPEYPESAAEHQAGTSAREPAEQRAANGRAAGPLAEEAEAGGVDEPDAYDSAPVTQADAIGDASAKSASPASDIGEPDALALDAAPEASAAVAPAAVAPAADGAGPADAAADVEPATWLLALGLVLSLGGGSLLLLGWLSRREQDPLLR